jgi:glutamate/tyrosine decarboxylase-like PLP-dependent enzyme
MKKDLTEWGFNLVKDFSFVKGTLEKEQNKLEQSFDKELKLKARALGDTNSELPSKGMSHEEILSLMSKVVEKENVIWEKGHLSGSVYHGQHGHKDFLNKCFGFYSLSNPLHPDIWPSVMKYESEIISMTANLVNSGKDSVCGCTTSGGTESIILAIKAHRDHWRENYGITEPELICAVTAHAAVDKACDMMNIKLIKVDVDPVTFRINLRSLKRAIGPNTIMLYASAPTYPHGSIDPVREMSKIAQRYNIGLHVDCCLGGFVLPFAKKAGFNIPGK